LSAARPEITIDPREVAMRVLAMRPSRVVITGGEPLLQGAELAKLIPLLKEAVPGLQVEIETNGSVPAPCADDAGRPVQHRS